MRNRALMLAVFSTGLTGCGTEPAVCSAELVALTTTVVNHTGLVLPGLPQVIDTVVRTGVVLEISAGGQGPALAVDGAYPVVILTDDFMTRIRPAGDAVVVTLRAGDYTARGEYVFGHDCHVHKVAGPDSLLLQ